jgi:hypothetical protein
MISRALIVHLLFGNTHVRDIQDSLNLHVHTPTNGAVQLKDSLSGHYYQHPVFGVGDWTFVRGGYLTRYSTVWACSRHELAPTANSSNSDFLMCELFRS